MFHNPALLFLILFFGSLPFVLTQGVLYYSFDGLAESLDDMRSINGKDACSTPIDSTRVQVLAAVVGLQWPSDDCNSTIPFWSFQGNRAQHHHLHLDDLVAANATLLCHNDKNIANQPPNQRGPRWICTLLPNDGSPWWPKSSPGLSLMGCPNPDSLSGCHVLVQLGATTSWIFFCIFLSIGLLCFVVYLPFLCVTCADCLPNFIKNTKTRFLNLGCWNKGAARLHDETPPSSEGSLPPLNQAASSSSSTASSSSLSSSTSSSLNNSSIP